MGFKKAKEDIFLEDYYICSLIPDIRVRERVFLKKAGIMQSFSISMMPIAPNVATVLSILLHIAFGNGLTISEVSQVSLPHFKILCPSIAYNGLRLNTLDTCKGYPKFSSHFNCFVCIGLSEPRIHCHIERLSFLAFDYFYRALFFS